MKQFRLLAILLVAITLAFTACDDGGRSNDNSGGSITDTVVTIATIHGVTPPAYGEIPVNTITETSQYIGIVSWSPVDDPFEAETVYTATITLTVKTGYTLTGVEEDFFTVDGATSVTNDADSGVVTAEFLATGAAPGIDVTFQSAVQTGGTLDIADSTGLTLTFSTDPTTLSVSNITVTGATKGALSGSGTTRSLAISNITVTNGATVSVRITSPAGYAITGSPKTAVVYRALSVGMAYQGGIIAYIYNSGDPGYVAGQVHGLIAATADQSTYIQWYNGINLTTGATGMALGTGQANTTAIVNNQGAGSYAAQVCDNYTNAETGTGVYSDWYLPSKDELNKLYLNKTAVGGFADVEYWSSSEYLSNHAWYQFLSNGYQNHYFKDASLHVRAVRAF